MYWLPPRRCSYNESQRRIASTNFANRIQHGRQRTSRFYFFQFLNKQINFKVIAMACGKDMNSLYYVGMVGIMDPPRPGCRESIETVQSAGVNVKMVTGDAIETACNIGIFYFCFFILYSFYIRSQIKPLSSG